MYSKTAAIISSAVLGALFGALSASSALVWIVTGLLIGSFIIQKRFIKWAGLSYGFFLIASFLIAGVQGTISSMFGFIALLLLLSLLGALLGWILVFIGNGMKNVLTSH